MRKEDTRDYFFLFSFLIILHSLSNQVWIYLATTYLNAVLDEIVMSQRFGKHIRNLIMGGNGVYLDHV